MKHPVNDLGQVLVAVSEVVHLLADERRVITASLLERFEQSWRRGKCKHASKVPSTKIRKRDAGRVSSPSLT